QDFFIAALFAFLGGDVKEYIDNFRLGRLILEIIDVIIPNTPFTVGGDKTFFGIVGKENPKIISNRIDVFTEVFDLQFPLFILRYKEIQLAKPWMTVGSKKEFP